MTDTNDDYTELKSATKNLLWNIGDEREKVVGSLNTLVNIIYKEYSEETKLRIITKIMKRINKR